MRFKATTIAPKGRNKYGQYFSTTNISKRVINTSYSGDNTNNDINGGGDGGGVIDPVDDGNFVLDLSKTALEFDGAQLPHTSITETIDIIGYKGRDRADTFVGYTTGDTTYDPDTETYDPPLPANYGITGVPQTGMDILVTDNGTTGAKIIITVNSALTQMSGTLEVPLSINLKTVKGSPLGEIVTYWEDAARLVDAQGVNVGSGQIVNTVKYIEWRVSAVGESNYRLDLTNESASINCDADGNILPGAVRPTCQAILYLGTSALTSDVTFGMTFPQAQNVQGVTINTNTGVITFGSNFQFDGTGVELTVSASHLGRVVGTSIMNVAKAYPGKDGVGAVTYWLVLSANAVKLDSGVPTPGVITANAMMQVGEDAPTAATGVSIYYGFNTDAPSTAYPSSGVTVDVTKDYISFVLKKGSAIVDGVETVPIIANGTSGASGESVYRLDLTNENTSINCDASGNILPGATRPTCTAHLYYGTNGSVPGTKYSITNYSLSTSGVSINEDTGVMTFNPGSASTPFNFTGGDTLEITIAAKHGVTTIATAIMTVTKSKAGANGEPGITYWLKLSADSVRVNKSGTGFPTTITATAYRQVGENNPEVATNATIKYGYDTDTPTSTYSSAITVDLTRNYITFNLVVASIVRDVETIPILRDGQDGQSVYRLDLTNENSGINCDSNGNILSGAVRPTCRATLYLGSVAQSNVSYSISNYSLPTSGVSINSSTGVLTFNAGTSSTPFNFTGGTALEITIQAKIGNVLYGTAIMTISKQIAGANGIGISGVSEKYGLSNSDSTVPTTWYDTVQTPTANNRYLWNYEIITYSNGSTASTPATILCMYSQDGKGISAITEYYAVNNSSASTPSTWYTTLQVPTASNRYLWNKEKVTYTDGTTAETIASIIGMYSQDGKDGNDATTYWLSLSADAVKVTTAGTFTPATITVTPYKQVGENNPVVTSDGTIKWGYDTTTPSTTYNNPIQTSGGTNYITVQYVVNGVVRDTETIPILRDGKDGQDGQPGLQGRQGAAVRGPVNWYTAMEESGRHWCNGSGTTGTEQAKFIDVILKDGVYYYCNTNYTEAGQSWASVSSYWTAAGDNFDFIATNLLLANNAKINFMTGNEIYLMDSSQTVTAGAAGGNGVSFWAGSDDPGAAPFQVNADGSIKATSGIFSGYIQMPYEFVSDLTPNQKISASTQSIGVVYLAQTIWKGKLPTAPENPENTWCYFNTSTSPGKFYYYKNSAWRLMTDCGTANGYLADQRAYLIADGWSGYYGMGDGGMLVIPEPSAALNGFTYHILAEPNVATKAQGENPAISIMTANQTTSFEVYAYVCWMEPAARLSFYGGHIELTCVKKHYNTDVVYRWALTQCTGGVDIYSGTTSSSFIQSFSTVAGYSTTSNYYTITKLCADPTLPSRKDGDTIYFSRN